jgi:hypothetical protein
MDLADGLGRDFTPFIDPATELILGRGTQGVRVEFFRNGLKHDYYYDATSHTIVARHLRERKFPSVRSLLASVEFADIRGLAATQVRMYRTFNVDGLIPPEGVINDERLTKMSLHRKLSPRRFDSDDLPTALDVILIDGPAGVGKTSLIESVMVQRARKQHDPAALPPILHVASRGRRLTGLNDALAQSIQLLRAKFTYDQVPVLVRYNLLQIAIDGFDELVDPEGYKDAWFALRDFFDDVSTGGPIILAGRDTFFDQQSFVEQISSSKPNLNLVHVRLQPSTPSTAREWLRQNGWLENDIKDPYTNIVLRPGSYALRPYFLSQLAAAKSWSAIDSKDLTPRSFLVENFLTREARLLSAQLPISFEEVKARLNDLFEEIALEMADNEVDSVDLGFLQLVTEVSFSGLLERQDLAKLQHKAGSFALLETDSREGHRRFPHTEISNHFLAAAIIHKITEGVQVRFLRRGIAAADFLAIYSELFCKLSPNLAESLIDKLVMLQNNEISYDRLSENTAALLIGSLCHQTLHKKQTFADMTMVDAVLFGVISAASLRNVRVQRLDIREAELVQVDFADCEVIHLTVDETSRFGKSYPDIHRLLLATEDGQYHELFEPDEISAWISRHSVQSDGPPENREAIRLFDRICRVMLRQHMVKEHITDPAGRLLHDKYWKDIEQILFKKNLLVRLENRGTRGAAATFLRLSDPFKLLVGKSNDLKVKEVWAQIGSIPER